MGIFKDVVRQMRLDAAQKRKLDEILHEVVDEEMTAREIRRGLWTKALAEAEGNEARAKGKYISLRVQSLTDEMLVMSDALRAAEEILEKYRRPEPGPEPIPQLVPEPVLEPESKSESVPNPRPEPGPEPIPQLVPEPVLEPESKSESVPNPVSGQQGESGNDESSFVAAIVIIALIALVVLLAV